MARVKYFITQKSETASIYVVFSAGRNQQPVKKTGNTINPKDWKNETTRGKDGSLKVSKYGLPINRNADLKNLKIKLEKLSTFLIDSYNNKTVSEIDSEWLQAKIDEFNGVGKDEDQSPRLSDCIQKFIDEAPIRENSQMRKLGLSAGRIRNLKLFYNTITRFEAETNKKKSFRIVEVDKFFINRFKSWLLKNGYSVNYIAKNLANLKTIIQDAQINDVETSISVKSIKPLTESKDAGEIVYLSFDELEQIAKAPIISTALNNTRKWLLLGCSIGQRGGDLLNLTEKNIKDLNGLKIIELKQQKTGKQVIVPLTPDALEVIKDGFPYPIALTKFNEYLKELCKVAGIDTPMSGRVKEHSRGATNKTTAPKWQFISSHVCRRSFASNYYGKIPTSVLMGITAHGTEQMFLRYIGKTSHDNAYQFIEYLSKLAPRTEKEADLKVIKTDTA